MPNTINYPRFIPDKPVGKDCFEGHSQERLAHSVCDYVRRIQTILNSLTLLNNEASDDAHYAGYMRYLLRKYGEIRDAVNIVNSHKDVLGISSGFHWNFTF